MGKPKKVFLASSGNAKPLAKALASYLRKEFEEAKPKMNCQVDEWYKRVFSPGRNILEVLVEEKANCDFAVVLLTKDDFGKKQGEEVDLPRDNVIFELGLFIAELGVERCFMVCNTAKIAIPTDLEGYIKLQFNDALSLQNDDDIDRAVEQVGPDILRGIKRADCYDHPMLPLVSREELCELERSKKEGGQLLMVRSSTAVVVNSVEPVELDDLGFCLTVLKNLVEGAQYEYYYGQFDNNIVLTSNLILNIATAKLQSQVMTPKQPDGGDLLDLQRNLVKENLKEVRQNLATMQRNLSIHFRRRPPLQFCVHNALSEENAICYLRCHGDYRDRFVRWAVNDEAKAIAEELRMACKEPRKESSIFHSTYDFELDKTTVMSAVTDVFPQDLPDDFYTDLKRWCVGG